MVVMLPLYVPTCSLAKMNCSERTACPSRDGRVSCRVTVCPNDKGTPTQALAQVGVPCIGDVTSRGVPAPLPTPKRQQGRSVEQSGQGRVADRWRLMWDTLPDATWAVAVEVGAVVLPLHVHRRVNVDDVGRHDVTFVIGHNDAAE